MLTVVVLFTWIVAGLFVVGFLLSCAVLLAAWTCEPMLPRQPHDLWLGDDDDA